MNRILSLFIAALVTVPAFSETFRVNNNPGSGAQFTNYKDAEAAASDGDVIVFDGSKTSYGDIRVTKRLTLKGPGYFLEENDVTSEGNATASFENITVAAEGATLTGLVVNYAITFGASNVVITRCYAGNIYHTANYLYSDKAVTNCIIHQNYILYGISGDNYSKPASHLQITNNIISSLYNLMHIDSSVISRNTIISGDWNYREITNCVIENNIAPKIVNDVYTIKGNSFSNNYFPDGGTSKFYRDLKPKKNDKTIKTVDETLATDKGAFSGDDPYVLSGLPSGPMIQDVIMPESVVQGENLKVTVNIGVSK